MTMPMKTILVTEEIRKRTTRTISEIQEWSYQNPLEDPQTDPGFVGDQLVGEIAAAFPRQDALQRKETG
jgi:hypothetical protein